MIQSEDADDAMVRAGVRVSALRPSSGPGAWRLLTHPLPPPQETVGYRPDYDPFDKERMHRSLLIRRLVLFMQARRARRCFPNVMQGNACTVVCVLSRSTGGRCLIFRCICGP